MALWCNVEIGYINPIMLVEIWTYLLSQQSRLSLMHKEAISLKITF